MNFHTKDVKIAAFLVYSGIPLLYKSQHDGAYWYTFQELKPIMRIVDELAKTVYQLKKEPVV